MKGLILSLIILFLVFSSAFAHSPESVDITVSVSEKNIAVSIVHPVSNPNSHYVKKVEVTLNDKKIIEQTFFLQEGNSQQAIYHIPSLKISDTLTVEVFCNMSGSQKKTVIVH